MPFAHVPDRLSPRKAGLFTVFMFLGAYLQLGQRLVEAVAHKGLNDLENRSWPEYEPVASWPST